ncbi:DUF2889 domain-containing protein [Caballeronia temeraria]|nr:DUF2889 domain-containing protein [Caballeronia temeraria]
MNSSFENRNRSPLITRDELHHRRIDMRGYRRSDGLFEVEAILTDRKSHNFTPASGGKTVSPGQPLHNMGVCLVFDAEMTVREAHTFIADAPYDTCVGGGENFRSLEGLRIASGWTGEVKRRLVGARSCAHLRELLIPLATTAIQTMIALRVNDPEPVDEHGRPMKINSCFAYSDAGEIVARRWPQYSQLKNS